MKGQSRSMVAWRHGWVIVFATLFLSCAITVFTSFTAIQLILLRQALSMPYGLPEEAVAVRVRRHAPPSQLHEVESTLSEVARILAASDTVLVLEGLDFGLAVYDPTGHFAGYPLAQGEYFGRGDFYSGLPMALVRYESPLHHMTQQGITMVEGKMMQVRGVYGREHPFFSDQRSFVVSLLHSSSLLGTWYFSKDSHLVADVMALLQGRGYGTQVVAAKPDEGVARRRMFNPLYAMVVAGLVFMFFNIFLANFVLLSRYRNHFAIHVRFGATRSRLLAKVLFCGLGPICLGALLGAGLYAVTFRLSDGFNLAFLPTWVAPLSIAVTIIASLALWCIAFLAQRVRTMDIGGI
ncbi:MAG: hypothetical protein KGZ92_00820 [Firmicutes bacterium]|nr:hypothetical protein [Dethiobacter sp.]MBS3887828.1 hypothetical protein [Bacillota bacterium]MBS4053967.1 hypothetical protein [Thermaerobacter sp.]